MTKVFGPYELDTWRAMCLLKTSIKDMLKQKEGNYTKALKMHKELLKAFVTKEVA